MAIEETTAARVGRAAGALFRPRSRSAPGPESDAAPSLAATVGSNLGRATGILTQPVASPSSGAAAPGARSSTVPAGSVTRSLGRAAGVFFRPRPPLTAPAPLSTMPGEAASIPPLRAPSRITTGRGYARALTHSSRHFLGSLKRVAHLLSLQIAGVLYLLFALVFGAEGYRSWTGDHRALGHHAASLTQMSATTSFELALCLVFAYFGISSLSRARQR